MNAALLMFSTLAIGNQPCCQPAPQPCTPLWQDRCCKESLFDRLKSCFSRDCCEDACKPVCKPVECKPVCKPVTCCEEKCRESLWDRLCNRCKRDNCCESKPVTCKPSCTKSDDCCESRGLFSRLFGHKSCNDCCGETIITVPCQSGPATPKMPKEEDKPKKVEAPAEKIPAPLPAGKPIAKPAAPATSLDLKINVSPY